MDTSFASWSLRRLSTHNQSTWLRTVLCSANYSIRLNFQQTCINSRGCTDLANKRREWSTEQLAIIARIRTHNVVVSARPGSGKTATAEAIVSSNLDKKVAVLTYSKRLQVETKKRLTPYKNCDVYTFHSMAGDLFLKKGQVRDDLALTELRSSRAQAKWVGVPYDIIILDEMQDCTPVLFWLLCLFINCVTHARGYAPRIVVLGDERQAIFEFRGADARFLRDCPTTMAALSPDAWDRMTLTKSFRLSYQNARFINKTFLGGEDYVIGSHTGPKPLLIHTNPFLEKSLAKELAPLIRKYGAERTAILGTTVRNNKTISNLTNYLTSVCKMPVAEPMSDDMALDELVIRGKICVSTIHQFKGSERDLVILYGLDDYYFKIAKDQPDDTCPNNMFVALSRARKQLVIIHDVGKKQMPFVNIPQLQSTATHRFLLPNLGLSLSQRPPSKPSEESLNLPSRVFASEIARHVPVETLGAIISRHINVTTLSYTLPQAEKIQAPDKVVTNHHKGHYEAVSDINGVAVVATYELELCGSLTTLGFDPKDSPHLRLPREAQEMASWICRQACRYLAEISTYRSRMEQMKDHQFDWLEPYLIAARDRLQREFRSATQRDLKFEYELSSEIHVECKRDSNSDGCFQTTRLIGRADTIQKHPQKSGQHNHIPHITLWEIKFVTQLSLEHIIQACVYAHLWSVNHGGSVPRTMLYNVQDGTKWEISPKDPSNGMASLVEEVLRAKYTSLETIQDDEFLNQCSRTRDEAGRLFND